MKQAVWKAEVKCLNNSYLDKTNLFWNACLVFKHLMLCSSIGKLELESTNHMRYSNKRNLRSSLIFTKKNSSIIVEICLPNLNEINRMCWCQEYKRKTTMILLRQHKSSLKMRWRRHFMARINLRGCNILRHVQYRVQLNWWNISKSLDKWL